MVDLMSKRYDDTKMYDRIPDYRHQLLWLPNLVLDKRKTAIEFFTSDVPGEYEITLEGFTNKGLSVSTTKSILVE